MKQATVRLKKKTSSESLSDRAYRELKKHILENKLTLGYQYTEQEVAELLRMSRTPTREAFLRLANEGLIEIRPRHGMRIKPISIHDMQEIYQILTSLESCAAELAARRDLSKTEIELLCDAVNEMEESLAKDDLYAWAEADSRFHRLLVKYSNNERLISLVDTFIDQSHRVRMLTLRLRPKPNASNEDHRKVVEAIVRRDGNAARQIHRVHRENSGRLLTALLKNLGVSHL